jgi:HEAT repeat protein
MRTVGSRFAAAATILLSAASAYAHGGSMNPGSVPPDPGVPLGPPWHGPKFKENEPELTPGGGDPKVAITRWETWWSNNKDAYLRLAERAAGDAPGATPSSLPPSERAKEAAERRATSMRKRLAVLFTEALADPSFEVRTAAAIALGKTGQAEGSEPLRRAALTDAHKDVRDSAVLGLGLSGRQADIPFLEKMLFDREENPRRRGFAAFAIGIIGGEDAAVTLLRFSDERPDGGKPEPLRKKPELAASVFIGMGMTGCADVLPRLRAAAADTEFDENVRSFALLSLGRLKDRASLAMLSTTLTNERDPALRRAAALALGRAAGPDDAAVVAALAKALTEDRDPLTKHFAATSLGTIGGVPVREALRRAFKEGDDKDRAFAALALGIAKDAESAPMVRAALEDKQDESDAGSLCIALGLMSDAASAPAIEKTLNGAKKVWLRGYAALALGMCGATSAVESLHKRLEGEGDPRMRMNLAMALGMLHDPKAKSYLVDTLRGADTFFEKGSAALALGALRMSAAVPDLEVVARDGKSEEMLRAFTLVALGDIADPSPVPKLSRFSVDGNYDAAVRVDPLNEVLTIY